jgi:biopolymer transport protein ExbD
MPKRSSFFEGHRRGMLVIAMLAGFGVSSCTRDETPPPATLVIRSTGVYELNGAAVKPESLSQALKALSPSASPLHLIIKAEPAATHQSVVVAMQAAQPLGARISFSSGSAP